MVIQILVRDNRRILWLAYEAEKKTGLASVHKVFIIDDFEVVAFSNVTSKNRLSPPCIPSVEVASL